MKLSTLLLSALPLALAAACDGSGGSSGTPAPAVDAKGDAAASASDVSAAETTAPIDEYVPNADCAYDPASKGTSKGAQIEDFKLKTWDGKPLHLHSFCGGGTKVLWVFLTTGSCGVCENYAPKAEEMYQQHKAQGLEILWIVGEDNAGGYPSLEYMQQYHADKGVTYAIVRDAGFAQVYAHLDPSEPALPHQYVLDGRNMDLDNIEGGVSEAAEQFVVEQLAAQ